MVLHQHLNMCLGILAQVGSIQLQDQPYTALLMPHLNAVSSSGLPNT